MGQELRALHCVRLTNLSYADTLSVLPFPSLIQEVSPDSNSLSMAGSAAESTYRNFTPAELESLAKAANINYLRLLQPGEHGLSGDRAIVEAHQGLYNEAQGISQLDPGLSALTPQVADGQGPDLALSAAQVPNGRPPHQAGAQHKLKRRRLAIGSKASHQQPLPSLLEDLSKATESLFSAMSRQEGVGDLRKISESMPACVSLLSKLHARRAVVKVPEVELRQLLELFEVLLSNGSTALDSETTMESPEFQHAELALQAANGALLIFTSEGLPRVLLREELVDRIVEVVSFNIEYNILPIYEPSLGKAKTDEPAPLTRCASLKGRQKGKGQSGSGSAVGEHLLGKACMLLPLISTLSAMVKLQDSAVSRISRTALSTFCASSLFELQGKSLHLLALIFLSYPQHHLSILDEVVQLLWSMPLSKKQTRSFYLKEDSLPIHTLSALVLHLIQSAVRTPPVGVMPEFQGASEQGTKLRGSSVSTEEELLQSYEQAEDAAKSFWRGLLVKCANGKASGELSEARTTTEELMDDFLSVASTPEFPAAGFLLKILSLSLASELGLKSDSLATRGMAIDLLGRLTVKLKQDDLHTKADRSFTAFLTDDLTQMGTSSGQTSPQSSQCYMCSSVGDLLPCGSCARSGHLACLGMTNSASLSSAWTCHVCSARQRLQLITSDSVVPDSRLVLQQLVVDYLVDSSSVGSSSAVRFLSAMLAKDARGSSNVTAVCQSWAARLLEGEGHRVISALPRPVILKATRLLEADRPLARSFDALVTHLLGCFHDKPQNRQKAIKAVSGIVEADPSELAKDHVRHYVEQRFSDSAISVREIALDLVGKHLLQRPELAEKYYPVICDRVKDTGTSVRKRAIRIIRDLCLHRQDFPHSVDACVKIFSRFNDEEASIRDLVLRTLHELWFESREDGEESVEQQVHRATCQMVEVLKQPRSQQAVIASIRQSIFDEPEDNPAESSAQPLAGSTRAGSTRALKANAAVRERCEKMCRHLHQSFLQVLEGDNEHDVLPYLVAMQAFCEVDPRLCAPSKDPLNAATMIPYLRNLADRQVKGQGSGKAQDPAITARMTETGLSVLTSLLPHIPRLQHSTLDSLQRSLARFIFQNEQLSVVQAAVRCLCKLQDISKQPLQQFSEVVKKLYASLQDPSARNSAPRCLFILGLFCRFGAKHLDADASGSITVSCVTSTLKDLYRIGQPLVKLKALQALGNVCVAEPAEMENAEVVEAYASCLAPDAPTALQVQVLKNLCEFAQISEEKPSQPAADSQDDTSLVVAVAAGANDTVTASGPIQRHWGAVLDCLLRPNSEVQQNALKLVDIALKQGIVFPVTCVSHLIALSADESEATSSSALRLLQIINSRWSAYKFVESKFAEGFRAAYGQLQPKLAHSKDSEGYPPYARQGLGKVYRMVRPTSGTKLNVLTSLIRRFDCEDLKTQVDLHYLGFCADVFASLPYEFLDEVLFVVTEASKIIHKRGGTLQTQLQKTIGPDGPLGTHAQAAYQLLKAKKVPDGDPVDAELEPSVVPCPPDVLQQTLLDAEAAGSICLLLLLKAYLKEAYNLTEAKCLAYGHAETPKFQEQVTRKEIPQPEFLRVASGYADKMCHAVFFYQKLKRLMSQETDKDLTALVTSSPKGRRRASLPGGVAHKDQDGAGDRAVQSAPPKRSQSKKRVLAGEQVPFHDLEKAAPGSGLPHSVPQVEQGKRRKRNPGKHGIARAEG